MTRRRDEVDVEDKRCLTIRDSYPYTLIDLRTTYSNGEQNGLFGFFE